MRVRHCILSAAVLMTWAFSAHSAEDRRDIIVQTMGMPDEQRALAYCAGLESNTLCDRILSDAQYRAQWLRTYDKLIKAERLREEAQDRINEEKAKGQNRLDEMRARAPKLPDGRAIFRTQDGQIVDEFGNPVPPELAALAGHP